MVQRLGFLRRQRQHFLHAGCVGNVANHVLFRPGADLLLDLLPDGLKVEAQFAQDIHSHALPERDQAQQQVLGADEVVVHTIRFFARQRQRLLGARSEIAEGFIHKRGWVLC
jgi:hypothetical protein